MVTYRCMLPAYRQYRYTGGAGNNTHHNTLNILSGRGPCIMFNTVLLLYLFCVFGIMYCATLHTVQVHHLHLAQFGWRAHNGTESAGGLPTL